MNMWTVADAFREAARVSGESDPERAARAAVQCLWRGAVTVEDLSHFYEHCPAAVMGFLDYKGWTLDDFRLAIQEGRHDVGFLYWTGGQLRHWRRIRRRQCLLYGVMSGAFFAAALIVALSFASRGLN